MDNKNSFIIFLVLITFLCGCTDGIDVKESDPTSFSAGAVPNMDGTILESSEPSESVQPLFSEPELSLPMEPGSYLMKYSGENTSDYLDYYLFIPKNAKIDMPVIVFLHGDGEVGKVDRLENYGMIAGAREIYGEEFPFIAISPCTRIYSWTEGVIPETLIGLINETIDLCSADPDRIILTGHSRGAMGVWYLISNYGDYFAAAVPVSCGTDAALNYDMCKQVPVLAMAGTSGDMEIQFQEEMRRIVRNLTEAGGKAELILLPDCEHKDTSKTAYTEETFRWMLEQMR